MFRSFFLQRCWWSWSILGSILILLTTWYQVRIDVRINEWYGDFYNALQHVLEHPGSISFAEFLKKCFTFARIAAIYIIVAVGLDFFTRHYIFRWRTAMNDYYMANWEKLRHIEGAAQRVQEDTMRFARIVEALGSSFLHSIMILAAFLPLLWKLSEHITEYPWIGEVPHGLVYIALLFAIFGTVVMALVGIRLPGLEFNNQLVEAAYRKELVYGEDHEERAEPETVKELFSRVRHNYFRLYFNYLYFDVVKWSYLQFTVILPLIALGPAIISGAITLGVLNQILNAFGKVEGSFQFLVRSWSTIVELISIYKRLHAFESILREEGKNKCPATH